MIKQTIKRLLPQALLLPYQQWHNTRAARRAFQPHMDSEFPRFMEIELTNACNLKCPMCPRTDSMTRRVGHMKLSLMKRIMDEIEQYGLNRLRLHVFGEAILHPECFELIAEAKRSTVKKVDLSINGVLLDEEKIRRLLCSNIDVLMLSIDSVNPTVYNEVRRGGDVEQLLRNVGMLLGLHRTMGCEKVVELQVIDFPGLESNVTEFVNYFSRYLSNGQPSGIEIRVKPYADWAEQVNYIQKERPTFYEAPCTYTVDRCTIHWNGDVVACCVDVNGVLKLGSVLEASLYDIWHSENYRQLREAHLHLKYGKFPLCMNCELRRKEIWSHAPLAGSQSTFIRSQQEALEFLAAEGSR